MPPRVRSLSSLVVLAAIAALVGGCDPVNKNDVDCLEQDCQASCETKGFPSGSEPGNVCRFRSCGQ